MQLRSHAQKYNRVQIILIHCMYNLHTVCKSAHVNGVMITILQLRTTKLNTWRQDCRTQKGKSNAKSQFEINKDKKKELNDYTLNVATLHDACKQFKLNCDPNPHLYTLHQHFHLSVQKMCYMKNEKVQIRRDWSHHQNICKPNVAQEE